MHRIIDFVSKMTWQDWATLGGFLFGIVTLIAYLDQRRGNKRNQVLIDFATRHVSKDISEETIQSLEQKTQILQAQIAQDIPIMARKAVLAEQRAMHVNAASLHYARIRQIDLNLAQTPSVSQLDPIVEKFISSELLPGYEFAEKKDAVRLSLTIYSGAAALVGALLPEEVRGPLLFFLAGPITVNLLRLAVIQKMLRIRKAVGVTYSAVMTLALFLLGLGVSIFLTDKMPKTGFYLGICLAIFAAIFFLFGILRRKVLRASIEKRLTKGLPELDPAMYN
jgi:hypothetical protein